VVATAVVCVGDCGNNPNTAPVNPIVKMDDTAVVQIMVFVDVFLKTKLIKNKEMIATPGIKRPAMA
jgi:hypothetical protein